MLKFVLAPVSLTGTFEINSKGETSFSFTKPTDMLLSEVEKLIDLPITIDTNGISTDIPMYKGLVDVNAVVAIEKGNEENSCKLKLGAKVGKEAKVYGDIKGGASVGAGIKIILQPSFQDGPFGTIENRKDNKINTDIRKANHYNSIDFFMRNIR